MYRFLFILSIHLVKINKRFLYLSIVFIVFLLFPRQNIISQESNFLSFTASESKKDIYKTRRNIVQSSLSKNNLLLIYNINNLTDEQKLYFGIPKNNYLLYLIGKNIDNSIFILYPSGININGRIYKEILFIHEQSNFEKIWEGSSITLQEIENDLGIEKALSLNYLDYYLDSVFKRCDTLYILSNNLIPDNLYSKKFNNSEEYNKCIYNIYFSRISKFLQNYQLTILTENKSINSLREIKDSLEISFIQKAIDITSESHLEVMKKIQPEMTEVEVQALMEYYFLKNGASGPAYKSIVASGRNAHILHRQLNNDTLHSGDLVIMDCGAEYKGYCADITRTIPVNGKFTKEQSAIYNIVLEAMDSALSVCKPGKLFMLTHQKASKVIKKRLKELNIIKEESEYTRYFNHGTSHYIGLDVHDVGSNASFKVGNVITIEPGIYIPEGSPCDSKWWKICVRIEDDILITNDKPFILSSKLPKLINEIEEIMNK